MKLVTKVLQRPLWEDVVKILMRSCQRSCMNLNRSLWEDLVKILLTSLKSPWMIRSLWEDLVETLVKSSLRGPGMILCRSLSEDLGEILWSFLRGPCMKILQMSCLRGACAKALLGCSWEVLVSRYCKILSSSSRSFYDDLVGFS